MIDSLVIYGDEDEDHGLDGVLPDDWQDAVFEVEHLLLAATASDLDAAAAAAAAACLQSVAVELLG